MKKTLIFDDFLSPEGRGVFEFIKRHCEAANIWRDEFELEAAMLANSFALYRENAIMCNRPEGATQEVGENGYLQVSVHYTIMKNEYLNILKHAPKFGLNPADLKKAFGEVGGHKKPAGFNLTVSKTA